MLRWLTVVASLFGLTVGIWAVATADEKKPEIPLARPAAVNPFGRGVAALGVIEPADKIVSLAAPESGLVMEVMVDVGDRVKAGDPLFRLDSRKLEADLVRAESARAAGESEVARWHALPRKEDVPPLEAAAAAAESSWQDKEQQRQLVVEAYQHGSGTDRDVSKATYAALAAKAEFDRTNADLLKMRSGGWQPDLVVAESNVARLRAEVDALKLLVARLTVRAPRDGTILRRQIEVGEYAFADSTRSAIILGDLSNLNIRAQVDEEDIGLVKGKPKASARTRGAVVQDIPLELVRIEPFARPKTDLMGTNSERVDTRVVDVLFRMTRLPDSPVFPGQAVDVFVDAGD